MTDTPLHNPIENAELLIKQEAAKLGFSACGICQVDFTEEHAGYLKNWLEKGFQGEMDYMNRNLDKRCNPKLLVDNAQSVIVTALNYYPKNKQTPEAAQFSYYAYGKDYHLVVKNKLRMLYDYINAAIAPVKGRIFCDTAPILEKYHAQKAGLGWIGKNTQLIIPGKGSFFFLGVIVLDIPLVYDTPGKDQCGNCRKCMDACPTKALVAPGQLDANRCLSYLSIEYKGTLPDLYSETAENQVYGCDICNKACPWNKDAKETDVEEFTPKEALLSLSKEMIRSMDDRAFNELFSQSAVKYAGLSNLKRNSQ